MKRSTINALILEAIETLNQAGFKLPPFAYWSPEDWKSKGSEIDEITENGLGWDVTDFGTGDYENFGLLLFTIRNGNYNYPEKYPKTYAEKIMIVKENQVTPYHFHQKKQEDIINRGGGNLVLDLYWSNDKLELLDKPFSVSIDGVRKECKPGERIILTPGESICLVPYLCHKFYGETGKGTVIVGEVSAVNDDNQDNFFIDVPRFPSIIEDEEPVYLLCTDYKSLASFS
jgi:D-lyxose ketol-isomerase